MQGGCSKVEVKQECNSRRRRRLLQAGDDSETLELSFGHISAGLFSKPICSETGNEEECSCTSGLSDGKLETMGSQIKNANGVTIGQLAGDGIEFIAPNTNFYFDQENRASLQCRQSALPQLTNKSAELQAHALRHKQKSISGWTP